MKSFTVSLDFLHILKWLKISQRFKELDCLLGSNFDQVPESDWRLIACFYLVMNKLTYVTNHGKKVVIVTFKLDREQKKQKLDQGEVDVNCEDNEPAPDTRESFNAIGTRKHLSTSSSCFKNSFLRSHPETTFQVYKHFDLTGIEPRSPG